MLLFQDVQIETFFFRKADDWLLVSDDEHVSNSGGEGLAVAVTNVGDIETSSVFFNVHQLTDSPNVVSAHDIAEFSGLVLNPGNNFSLFKIIVDCVSLVNIWVRESDSAGVVSDEVWDLVWSEGFSFDFQKLSFSFALLDADEGESTLLVIEHSVVFVGLDDGQHIHNSNWEFTISSDFIVDFKTCFFVHGYEGDFPVVKSETKSFPELKRINLITIERGKHSLSLWGPWLGLVA